MTLGLRSQIEIMPMLTPRQDYEFLIKEMRTLTLSDAAASGEAESPVGGHKNEEAFTEAAATDADADTSDTATLNSNEERPEDTAAPSSFTRSDVAAPTTSADPNDHRQHLTTLVNAAGSAIGGSEIKNLPRTNAGRSYKRKAADSASPTPARLMKTRTASTTED
ncbi:hypothetical protein C8J57DRAFT_1255949 [Mycena rebaudengoi]|nr:hypothetical protein C8J57DRAFT_1255949 [Mycena rebaudengoi]